MNEFTGENLPLTELQHPMLRTAYDYWFLKKGDRELPSRKDISPEEMKVYLANVMLIDVSYDPLDFVYRVFGSGVGRVRAGFGAQGQNLVDVVNDSLGKEKADGEIQIASRCAHGNRERRPVQANLQRLLDGKQEDVCP